MTPLPVAKVVLPLIKIFVDSIMFMLLGTEHRTQRLATEVNYGLNEEVDRRKRTISDNPVEGGMRVA